MLPEFYDALALHEGTCGGGSTQHANIAGLRALWGRYHLKRHPGILSQPFNTENFTPMHKYLVLAPIRGNEPKDTSLADPTAEDSLHLSSSHPLANLAAPS